MNNTLQVHLFIKVAIHSINNDTSLHDPLGMFRHIFHPLKLIPEAVTATIEYFPNLSQPFSLKAYDKMLQIEMRPVVVKNRLVFLHKGKK